MLIFKHYKIDRFELDQILFHVTLSYLMAWEGKSKYDKAVRCSHTPPHSLILTHVHANVTVSELLPVDRTGL